MKGEDKEDKTNTGCRKMKKTIYGDEMNDKVKWKGG